MKVFKALFEVYGYRIIEAILVCMLLMILTIMYSIEIQHEVNTQIITNQREILRLLKK